MPLLNLAGKVFSMHKSLKPSAKALLAVGRLILDEPI